MLAEYKRKQNEASKEAEELLAHAKVEAERLAKEAETEMEAALQRREAAALEKIAQAETKALAEVRGQAVDVAIAAAGKLLSEKIDDTSAGELIDRSIEEGLAVARATGHDIGPAYKGEMWEFYRSMPAGATASMQRDIIDGRPSELDAWNGAICRFGAQAGVETPVHSFTYHLLLPMERRARGPLPHSPVR